MRKIVILMLFRLWGLYNPNYAESVDTALTVLFDLIFKTLVS